MKPPLIWKTEVYDRAGTVIGTITKSVHGGIVIEGGSDAFTLCLPDLRQAATFFTDPDALARSAYEAFHARDLPGAHATWPELHANESQAGKIARWKRVAKAVLTTPTVATSVP
jgi:hypothetical protein